MASIQNIVYGDQGVNWRVSFEYSNDDQQTWDLFEALFPRDFDAIPEDEKEHMAFVLAASVARGQGIDV